MSFATKIELLTIRKKRKKNKQQEKKTVDCWLVDVLSPVNREGLQQGWRRKRKKSEHTRG